ncbi:MAG: hypothetical protein K2N28_05070 [Muribaculaceae bacterium]|nr:hypothetical protein [Muribaculaceae bacterium]
MYNAATKFIAGALCVLAITSCNSESESARAARLLYEEAGKANIAGEPVRAIALLDSLKNAYPAETEWQRASMKLRPTLIINASDQQIRAVDDSLLVLEQEHNSLQSKMKVISNAQLVEPYYVDAASYDPQFMNSTGIQPRVSTIGQMYFLSSANGGALKHTGFTISCDGESVQGGPIAYDGELNYRIDGSEIVTYPAEQSDAVGAFVKAHKGSPMTLTLTGAKNKTMKLTPKQIDAIINCYDYSHTIMDARQLAFEKERLNRQLEIARSQAERLATQSGD